MAETIISKQIIRRGNLAQMPFLSSGEFGLAEDEQRLFLGQKPILGVVSTQSNTDVSVTFSTAFNTQSQLVDLDAATDLTYKVVVYDGTQDSHTDIPSTSIDTSDGTFSFAHGLGREPDAQDSFTLYWNKEVTSYKDDDGSTNTTRASYLEKSLPSGQMEDTGIVFLSNIKNSITLDYSLFIDTTTDIRQGTLKINIEGDSTSSIVDNYSMSTETLDVEFSVSTLSPGKFTLQFDTTYNGRIQFNYIEKSYKRLVSV